MTNSNNVSMMSYKDYKLMTQTKDWFLQQITPITTLQRQYNALCCIAQITPHLLQIILQPDKHTKQMQKKFRIPNKLDQKLKKIYNESQYKAISQCLRQTGITLIQGPPGTGKTKTVIGTLSILLNSYRKTQEEEYEPLVLSWNKSKEVQRDSDKLLNPWLYTGYTDWRDEPYISDVEDPLNLTSCYLRCDATDRRIQLKNKQEGVQLPERVLICGPSNASVDQIIRKLIKQQLFDSDGKSYLPNFVRVGQHYDQSLKQYSLDYLAEKLAEKQHGADLNMYKNKILNQYRLIFATLSAAGNQMMQNSGLKFDTVVIDQAGQSIQISNLIPLLYGCQRLILIGDPNQLPATVFSEKSIQHKYDQSLFERLMKSGYPVNVLKMQYRMHPDISAVIGTHFYGQKLTNWENIIVQEPKATSSAFVIFHMEEAPQISYKKSFRNMVQAKAVKQFASYLSKYYQDIGIISPYSQQVSLIQSLLPSNKKFQTKTIDSFQGRQKQVIVFSTVRSRYAVDPKDPKHKIQENKRKTIGFVNDLRRINVSLSRARNLCVIFGDVKRLAINGVWKKIVTEAIDRGQVFVYAGGKGYFEAVKGGGGKHVLKSLE